MKEETSTIVAVDLLLQSGAWSDILRIDARLELELLGSKNMVTSADLLPLNTLFLQRIYPWIKTIELISIFYIINIKFFV